MPAARFSNREAITTTLHFRASLWKASVLGPGIGFAVSGHSPNGQPSVVVPFLAAGLSALNLVFAFFLLPESLKPETPPAFGRRDLGLARIQRALSHPRVGLPIMLFFLSAPAWAARSAARKVFLRFASGSDEQPVCARPRTTVEAARFIYS